MAINTVLATNVMALTAHRNLTSVGNSQAKSSKRLSSGKKINSACDDAAGLAISEKMKAQIRGLDAAERNVEDGISLIQTFDSPYAEILDMFQRSRELIIQAANDTNTSEDREKLFAEIRELIYEAEGTIKRTQFNSISLNDLENVHIQVGASSGHSVFLDNFEKLNFIIPGPGSDNIKNIINNNILPLIETIRNIDLDPGSPGFNGSSVYTHEKFNIADISEYTNKLYSHIEELESNLSLVPELSNLISDLKNSVKTAIDIAVKDTYDEWQKKGLVDSDLTTSTNSGNLAVFNNTTITAKDVSDALNDPTRVIISHNAIINLSQKLADAINTFTQGIDAVGEDIFKVHITTYIDNTLLNESFEPEDFGFYIDMFDSFISEVSSIRVNLGAMQSRLESTSNNIKISSENLSAANSRIEDADMAKEMMNLTKDNILQQASTAMLAQANQVPNNVTQLLG